MQNPESNPKVSLEELLRLKRAERPSQEFWQNFEREMRQKQLTALVKKRHWWHNMPVLLGRRVYIPAGAAAAVAFSLVSLRFLSPQSVAEAEDNASPLVAVAEPKIEVLPVTVVAGLSTREEESYRVEPTVASAEPAPVRSQVSDESPVMVASSDMTTPSSRSIAANLARLEQSEPELIHSVMGSRLSSPARTLAVASVQPETEADSAQRYRLIARYADRALSPQPVAPASVRERIARRLGDDLVDDISRIGVKGSRVSLKF
jgi:hypothetical protein